MDDVLLEIGARMRSEFRIYYKCPDCGVEHEYGSFEKITKKTKRWILFKIGNQYLASEEGTQAGNELIKTCGCANDHTLSEFAPKKWRGKQVIVYKLNKKLNKND